MRSQAALPRRRSPEPGRARASRAPQAGPGLPRSGSRHPTGARARSPPLDDVRGALRRSAVGRHTGLTCRQGASPTRRGRHRLRPGRTPVARGIGPVPLRAGQNCAHSPPSGGTSAARMAGRPAGAPRRPQCNLPGVSRPARAATKGRRGGARAGAGPEWPARGARALRGCQAAATLRAQRPGQSMVKSQARQRGVAAGPRRQTAGPGVCAGGPHRATLGQGDGESHLSLPETSTPALARRGTALGLSAIHSKAKRRGLVPRS